MHVSCRCIHAGMYNMYVDLCMLACMHVCMRGIYACMQLLESFCRNVSFGAGNLLYTKIYVSVF